MSISVAPTVHTPLDSMAPGQRLTLKRRRESFRLHHIPNWFRMAVLQAKRTHGWSFAEPATSGWQVLLELQRRFESFAYSNRGFDHYGSCGPAFVSQPYMPIAEARRFAQTIADALDLDFTVDGSAVWNRGCAWVEWMPTAAAGLFANAT
jgi:hypothetical protein